MFLHWQKQPGLVWAAQETLYHQHCLSSSFINAACPFIMQFRWILMKSCQPLSHVSCQRRTVDRTAGGESGTGLYPGMNKPVYSPRPAVCCYKRLQLARSHSPEQNERERYSVNRSQADAYQAVSHECGDFDFQSSMDLTWVSWAEDASVATVCECVGPSQGLQWSDWGPLCVCCPHVCWVFTRFSQSPPSVHKHAAR